MKKFHKMVTRPPVLYLWNPYSDFYRKFCNKIKMWQNIDAMKFHTSYLLFLTPTPFPVQKSDTENK